jgi:glycosyltransferase involved in cell wall biosynthesis
MYCLSSVSGGAVAYLRNLAPLLAERFARDGDGHSLKFLAHEEQAPLLEGIEDSQVCWIRGARPKGVRVVWWEQRNLPAIVRKNAADVLFLPCQVGSHAPELRRVLMLRNMEPFLFERYHYGLKTWLRNRLLRRESVRCLRAADRVIAVSGFARERLIHGIGVDAARVRTVYHGRPDQRSSAHDARDQEILTQIGLKNHYVLTCGSLLPYRRCEDVIAAFNQGAPGLGARMRLVIAGSGTDRSYGDFLRRTIAASPLHERILAVGHVPSETMGALYRRCVACVIATEIEACPNIAIEAMAAGCVIVSSDRAPLPEMFQGCSLEYRARNIGHLVQQLRLAVENNSLRREMKSKALKRVEDFSWEKCARETYSALVDWQE